MQADGQTMTAFWKVCIYYRKERIKRTFSGAFLRRGENGQKAGRMDLKRKLIWSLSRATCDKTELDRLALKYKKCFDEASAALNGKDRKKER